MAKQTINLGTMADNKSGDPLRTAFTKINQNFDELYAGGVGQGGTVDLTGYATQTYVNTAVSTKVNTSSLSAVATSGSYTDLTNKPTLFSGSYADLTGKPSIPSISGLASEVYVGNALTGYATQNYVNAAVAAIPAPNLSGYATETFVTTAIAAIPATNLSGYATETYVNNAVSNLVASAPSTLNTLNELATALGSDPNFATTMTNALGSKANTSSLSAVATSGSYSDLTNKPTLFSGSYSDLTNKPTLFSGSYTDLTNKPSNITTFYNNAGYQTAADVMTLTTNMGFQTQTQVANAITTALQAANQGGGTPTTTYTATAVFFGGSSGMTLSAINVAGTTYYVGQFNASAVTITNVGSDYTISVDSTTLNNSQMLQDIQMLTYGQQFNPWYDGNSMQLSLNLNTVFTAGTGSSTGAPTFTIEKTAYMTAGLNPPGIIFYSNGNASGTMTLYGNSFDAGVPTQIKDAILALGEIGTFKVDGPLTSGSGTTTVTLASGWTNIGGGNYSASYISNNAIADQQTIWSVTAAVPSTAATAYYGASVPSTSVGVTGDKAGYIASDSQYLYICVRDYDGNPSAWKRIPIDVMWG